MSEKREIEGWTVDGTAAYVDKKNPWYPNTHDHSIHVAVGALTVETLGASHDGNVPASIDIPLAVIRAVLAAHDTEVARARIGHHGDAELAGGSPRFGCPSNHPPDKFCPQCLRA